MQRVFLSFWDVEMSNFRLGTFRKRVLSGDEARSMINLARDAGTLLCVAEADLAAPYCERVRERHRELCAALRSHANIDLQLKDFVGDQAVNPLCLAEIGEQQCLLVVDCEYTFDSDAARREAAITSRSSEMSLEQKRRQIRESLKTNVAPDSIAFYLFEQVGAA